MADHVPGADGPDRPDEHAGSSPPAPGAPNPLEPPPPPTPPPPDPGPDDRRPLVVELDDATDEPAPDPGGPPLTMVPDVVVPDIAVPSGPGPAAPSDPQILRVDVGALVDTPPPLPPPATMPPPPAPTGRPPRAAFDLDLITTGWLGPFVQSWLVVGVVAVASLVTGGVLAYVATGNLDAVRPGVPAGGFLFYAAFGGDVSVVVEHPEAVVGFSVEAFLITWVLVPTAMYVLLVARTWRRMGALTAAAWLYVVKLAVCTGVALAAVGLFANREMHRGTERIVSTASVGSTIVRGVLLVLVAAAVVALSCGVAGRLSSGSRRPAAAGLVRTFTTAAGSGIAAGVLALMVFGAIGTGLAVSAAPDLRGRLPLGVLAPQLAGNFAGLTTPVGAGGSTEIGAKRAVGVGVDGARSVDIDRIETTLGDDHALTDGGSPLLFPLGLLVLPGLVAVGTLRALRATRSPTVGGRAVVVVAIVAGVVAVVAGAAQLAALRVSGIVADPNTGVAVLGSADMATEVGRAAWLALLWSGGAAGLTAVLWTSRNPVAARTATAPAPVPAPAPPPPAAVGQPF